MGDLDEAFCSPFAAAEKVFCGEKMPVELMQKLARLRIRKSFEYKHTVRTLHIGIGALLWPIRKQNEVEYSRDTARIMMQVIDFEVFAKDSKRLVKEFHNLFTKMDRIVSEKFIKIKLMIAMDLKNSQAHINIVSNNFRYL